MSAAALTAASVPDGALSHLSLWNTAAYYDLNPEAQDRRVQIDHSTDDERLVGSLVGARVDDRLVSGFGAPFGGVDFVRHDETPQHVIDLVRRSLERAEAEGISGLDLKLRPPHHGSADAHLLFVLLTVGATVELANLNFFVDVSVPAPSADSWLQPRARKAMRRAASLGWWVEQLAGDDDAGWADAYGVLERNRVDKGRPMRLSFDYVRRLRDTFDPLARMHVLRDAEGITLAAALLYRTAPGNDVVQYWGDRPADRPVSPMPLLAHEVFAAARAAGAHVVDLGISTDDGRPNHGLIQFKRSVGAQTELRLELSVGVAEALGSPRWERLIG